MKFSKTVLDIDSEKEILRVSEFIRESTFKKFRRRGAVVGLSGGIDSAVVAISTGTWKGEGPECTPTGERIEPDKYRIRLKTGKKIRPKNRAN